MAGQGNKRSAPRPPQAPPQSQPPAPSLGEASTPTFACCSAPAPSCCYSRDEVRPGVSSCVPRAKPPWANAAPAPESQLMVSPGSTATRQHSPHAGKWWVRAVAWGRLQILQQVWQKYLYTCIFKYALLFSLYKYIGSSRTLGLADPSMPLFIWWTSCFSGLFT